MDLAEGSVVAGRYLIERKLGEGGMGIVWAASHTITRARVALKTLRPDKARDEAVRRRFVREARAASAVRHPNIIEVRDVINLEDGTPVIVMDLLEGESLAARLARDTTLSVADAAAILVQVVSAVGAAHAVGIVHRDLKPDNVFLVPAEGGRVSARVLDFGIAKVIASLSELDVSHGLTNTGAVLGTPFYMAPEQLFGERDIDQRTDVWAIGVILYECLAGRRPTEAENIGQILRLVTNDAIKPLRSVAPNVPDDLGDLVDRMLAGDRKKRATSLREAQDVLARHAPGVATPSFGEPRAAETRTGGGSHTLIDSGDHSGPLSATQLDVASGESRPSRASGDHGVSGTATTLASTTASLSADHFTRASRKRRRVVGLAVVVAVIALGSGLVAVASRTAPEPAATGSSPPPSAEIARIAPPTPSASVTASAEPAPIASSTAPSTARAPIAQTSGSARGRVTPSAAPATTAPSTTGNATPKFNPYEHM